MFALFSFLFSERLHLLSLHHKKMITSAGPWPFSSDRSRHRRARSIASGPPARASPPTLAHWHPARAHSSRWVRRHLHGRTRPSGDVDDPSCACVEMWSLGVAHDCTEVSRATFNHRRAIVRPCSSATLVYALARAVVSARVLLDTL